MSRIFAVLISSAVLLGGCESAVQKLSKAADATRTATEHAATANEASSDAKEAKIYADARNIERNEVARQRADAGQVQRYEVRRDATGWSIYDNETGRTARSGAKAQAGLTEREAYQSYQALRQSEEESNSVLEALHPERSAHK